MLIVCFPEKSDPMMGDRLLLPHRVCRVSTGQQDRIYSMSAATVKRRYEHETVYYLPLMVKLAPDSGLVQMLAGLTVTISSLSGCVIAPMAR
jgi:hypothetical protein